MPQSLDALANAARLRQSPGRSNFANYEDIFAGPAEGAVPSAHEMFTGRQNSDEAATALGAGPAISALRRAFDANQLLGVEEDIATEANLAGGRPQRIATMQAEAGNDVADIQSEGAAGRQFLPFADQLHRRSQGELDRRLTTQYLLPAQLRAQGDVRAAETTAQGRVAAVGKRNESLPMQGLFNALSAILNNKGELPSPEELARLRAQFGVQ